jgi:hypothetical protein
MTETIPSAENIAAAVRHSSGPTGDMAELSAQAQRLRKALEVAQAWERAAGSSSEMFAHATYTADKLEEELSRVIFEMEVLDRRRLDEQLKEEHPDFEKPTEQERRVGVISDTLLAAYCTLSVAPLEVFGVGERVAEERTRYEMMGALLAAQDTLAGE